MNPGAVPGACAPAPVRVNLLLASEALGAPGGTRAHVPTRRRSWPVTLPWLLPAAPRAWTRLRVLAGRRTGGVADPQSELACEGDL